MSLESRGLQSCLAGDKEMSLFLIWKVPDSVCSEEYHWVILEIWPLADLNLPHWYEGNPASSVLGLLPAESDHSASEWDVSWLALPWLLCLGSVFHNPPVHPTNSYSFLGCPSSDTHSFRSSITHYLSIPSHPIPGLLPHLTPICLAAAAPSELHSHAAPFSSVLLLINIFSHSGPGVTSGSPLLTFLPAENWPFVPSLPSPSYLGFNPCLGFSSHRVVTRFP